MISYPSATHRRIRAIIPNQHNIHPPSRKSIQHRDHTTFEQYRFSNPFRPISALSLRITLPAPTPLLRLRRRIHPTLNHQQQRHILRPPRRRRRHPIPSHRRTLPALLHQNPHPTPRRRPPRDQRHLRRRRRENQRRQQSLVTRSTLPPPQTPCRYNVSSTRAPSSSVK